MKFKQFSFFLVALLFFVAIVRLISLQGVQKVPSSKIESFGVEGTVRVELDEAQKIAYQQVYQNADLSNLIQLSGRVTQINEEGQSVEVETGKKKGWIKISSSWHGNVLSWNKDIGSYFEIDVINLPQGEWEKMVKYLGKSKSVLFTCIDNLCQQSIGGHLYLD